MPRLLLHFAVTYFSFIYSKLSRQLTRGCILLHRRRHSSHIKILKPWGGGTKKTPTNPPQNGAPSHPLAPLARHECVPLPPFPPGLPLRRAPQASRHLSPPGRRPAASRPHADSDPASPHPGPLPLGFPGQPRRPRPAPTRTHCPWRRRDRPPPSAALTAAPLPSAAATGRRRHVTPAARSRPPPNTHTPLRAGTAPDNYPCPEATALPTRRGKGRSPPPPPLAANGTPSADPLLPLRATGSASRRGADQAVIGQP